jgi:uncharacterized protein (UPF0210 family)
MEIRSITFFADPGTSLDGLVSAAADARNACAAADYKLQTLRLATTPFPVWMKEPGQVFELAGWCENAGIDYLAIGPVRLIDDPTFLDYLPEILAHGTVFASSEIADTAGKIDLGRVAKVAALVKELANLRDDGFANLYFTATANCPAGSPFFPVSYHNESAPITFAIATEAADLALTCLHSAKTLVEARTSLLAAIEGEATRLVRVAGQLAGRQNLVFGGIDFSLAPFPDAERSLGAALEALGVPAVGAHGTLFAAAFLADCVNRADFPRCGFSGLMLPVLEDATLAHRAAERILTINDLLLYSAVCGAGLDTVPLAGDVPEEELVGILLDLAALAARLDKPLTARLMPLPGLSAGDPVTFDFPYFADSRVMATKGLQAKGILQGQERIDLRRLGQVLET